MPLNAELDSILMQYAHSFKGKTYTAENEETDVLMSVFDISPSQKRENRQYWGRELGMCWQRLVVAVAKATREDYQPALRIGHDEPCDLRFGGFAIDTKYRVGSGDSGTLKKFKQYGPLLKEQGYTPVLLFLRTDNLAAAITACTVGGWTIYSGQDSFDFLKAETGYDLQADLVRLAGTYSILETPAS